MDETISESVDLGVMLLFSVAAALFISVICNICRTAYLERSADIDRAAQVTTTYVWEDLNAKQNNDGTSTIKLDTMLKWINDYEKSYLYCVLIKDATNVNNKRILYSNFELTDSERSKIASLFAVSTIKDNLSAFDITTNIRKNLQSIIVTSNAVQNGNVTPVVFPSRLYFSLSTAGLTGADLQKAQGIKNIPVDYAVLSTDIFVFIIN